MANNLNDLGKVYPALLTRTCAAWLDKGSAARRALVEHALRSAVKRGDAGALSLLGFGRRPAVCVEHARLQPPRIVLGQSVAVSFELKSTSHEPQSLLVDLVVHFVKANGQARPKVFKLKRLTLAPGAAVRLERKISFAALTTRQHFPGAHAFDVHVNGVRYHVAELDVRR